MFKGNLRHGFVVDLSHKQKCTTDATDKIANANNDASTTSDAIIDYSIRVKNDANVSITVTAPV